MAGVQIKGRATKLKKGVYKVVDDLNYAWLIQQIDFKKATQRWVVVDPDNPDYIYDEFTSLTKAVDSFNESIPNPVDSPILV